VANHLPGEGPPRPPFFAALSERQWFATCALATCVGLALLTVVFSVHPHEKGERLLLAVLACGAILAMRRWPLPVLVIAATATCFDMASGNATIAFGVLLGLAVYLVAARLPRRQAICATMVTAAATTAALVAALVTVRTASLTVEMAVGFVPLVAAWFVGDSVATRRRYLAGLAEQARRAEAAEAERARQDVREERVRIARELHDVVAHTLTVITVQAGVGRRLMARRPEEAGNALASIEAIGRTAQDELRVVLGLLRDEEVEGVSLAPAPRLMDLKELVETVRDSGIPVELRMSGTDRPLSPSLELSIYRVVQEALTNVVKHAPGASASVSLAVTEHGIRVEIVNNGGAAANSPARSLASADPVKGGETGRGPGHGIVGMRERVGAFGGWLAAEALPDHGFRVLARIPLEDGA